MAFKLQLLADVRDVIRGTSDMRAGLEDVADALDDVAREADAAGRDVQDALEDAGKGAGDAGDKIKRELTDAVDDAAEAAPRLERKFRDAMRDIPETAGKAGRDASKEFKKPFEDEPLTAGDVFKADLKAELVGNMVETGSEVVRGFKDGFDAEDAGTVIDGLTDTMASVGAMGGPVGAAAGLAGGAVLQAFAGPFLADAEKTAEQFESTFSTAFSNIVESGAELGKELSIAASVEEFVQDTDKMNAATSAANELGLERGVILRAMAGDQDAYNIVLAAQQELTDPLVQSMTELGAAGQAQKGLTQEQAAGLNTLNEQLEDARAITEEVTSSYNTNTDALNAATEAASAKAEADAYAAEKAIDLAAKQARSTGTAQEFDATIDGLNRRLRATPDGKIVDITDGGSVSVTQSKIDGISGGYKTVNVAFDQYGSQRALNRTVSGLVVPPVTVQLRYGQRAV